MLRNVEENLPVDFGCVCLYDSATSTLTVSTVGTSSRELAQELKLAEGAEVPIDGNGLTRCIRGELVYEPDVREVDFPFPQRLAAVGLCSLVIAPLSVEASVFGIFLAARRAKEAFSSGDCEFLKQLSGHVALAAHQSRLHGALRAGIRRAAPVAAHAPLQQERLRALGQMASGIAHDINNALSPVSIYTESLLEREPNLEPADAQLTRSHPARRRRRRGNRGAHARVLSAARAADDADRSRSERADRAGSRADAREVERSAAAARHRPSTCARSSTPDLPVIRGAEDEIRDALTNLIFNAVDAMPSGGTLTVRTRARNRSSDLELVIVEVEDTGVGMDEETRRRCLEPFFTTKGERGTGLGLAMVYGMIQRHSAEFAIESAVGAGTTMQITFPAYAASRRRTQFARRDLSSSCDACACSSSTTIRSSSRRSRTR